MPLQGTGVQYHPLDTKQNLEITQQNTRARNLSTNMPCSLQHLLQKESLWDQQNLFLATGGGKDPLGDLHRWNSNKEVLNGAQQHQDSLLWTFGDWWARLVKCSPFTLTWTHTTALKYVHTYTMGCPLSPMKVFRDVLQWMVSEPVCLPRTEKNVRANVLVFKEEPKIPFTERCNYDNMNHFVPLEF